MKGTKLALAKASRDHARLFLERKKAEDMFSVTERIDGTRVAGVRGKYSRSW